MYDSSWPLDDTLIREGITIIGIPFGRMCVESFEGDRQRTLLRNIVYVGSLAALLQIDMDVVSEMLREKFSKKKSVLDANFRAIKLGYDYAKEHYDCPLPFHLAPMDETKDSILLDGNSACALGAVYAGATVGAWYPITPSTSLMEAFKEYSERFRIDPETKQRNYALIQAEDELAAAGMVIGAGWAGARAFTSTAGPGISLMSEFIGLAYYTEIPGVFFDIQRTGPSTGMPTRTQQGDLLSIAYLSHGDTKHIALFPANPEECFYLAVTAFDLAERFQTPVFVVSDLDIGMNDWMCPRLKWDDAYRPDRGKVLGADGARYDQALLAIRRRRRRRHRGAHTARAFIRAADISRAARGTTSTPPTPRTPTSIRKSWTGWRASSPQRRPRCPRRRCISRAQPHAADVGIISLGGCHAAVLEAVARLRGAGQTVDYMRIRAFPFPASVRAFIDAHERCLRRRAESRRAAALVVGDRDRRGAGLHGIDPRLRRYAVDGGSGGERSDEWRSS